MSPLHEHNYSEKGVTSAGACIMGKENEDSTKEIQTGLLERLQKNQERVVPLTSRGRSVLRRKYPPTVTVRFLPFTSQGLGRNRSKIFLFTEPKMSSSPFSALEKTENIMFPLITVS